MKIREVRVLNAFAKSRVPDCDYIMNPYIGCSHKCAYCYARSMNLFSGSKESRRNFLDVKTNITWALENQLKRVARTPFYSKGRVLLSSGTDPYQPIENKYKLTRRCLELLSYYDWKTSVLTKSDLVLRDMKILKKFKNVEVGLSIGTLNSDKAMLFEPGTTPVLQRLKALEELSKNGIKTYLFIAPVFPYITDLERMFKVFSKSVDKIYVETLNSKTVNWRGVRRVLGNDLPELLPKYERIFFTSEKDKYLSELEKRVHDLGKVCNVKTKVYLHK